MRQRIVTPGVQAVLLIGFASSFVLLWMLPVLMTGLPLQMPAIGGAQEYLSTGIVPKGDGRLTAVIIAALSPVIDWSDLTRWSFVSAVALALSLLPFWWSVRKIFGVRIAWVTVAVFGAMPYVFRGAMGLTTYSFAFLFLFLSFAAFIFLQERSRIWAVGVAGALFGLTLAMKDTFIIFLPWYVFAYVWFDLAHWRLRCAEAALFLAAAFVLYAIPILPDALSQGTFAEKVLYLLPIERGRPGIEEIYGDQYTYDFDRVWFEEKQLNIAKSDSLIEAMRDQHRLVSYGVGDGGLLRRFKTGSWLFLNKIPSYFFLDTVGGFVLWLFVIPGGVSLFRRHRNLFVAYVGLVATTELIVRYLLQFQRIHLMNHGWGLALLAAIGVAYIADALAPGWKRIGSSGMTAIIAIALSLHLLQVNRAVLARDYLHSGMPRLLSAIASLKTLPSESRTALPDNDGVEALSGRKIFFFREDSLRRMLEQRRTREVFAHYGITHIMGYPDDLMATLAQQAPGLYIVEQAPAESAAAVTPALQYLLNIIR